MSRCRALVAPLEHAAQVDAELGIVARALDPNRNGAAAAVAPEDRIDDLEQYGSETADGFRYLRVEQKVAGEAESFRLQCVCARQADLRAWHREHQVREV